MEKVKITSEFAHAWIDEAGKELSKGRKDVFVTLETLKMLFCEYYHVTKDELEKMLNSIKSHFYDKYVVLGFYDGKKIFRSRISTLASQIFKEKIINKLEDYLEDYSDYQFVFDLMLERLKKRKHFEVI